MIHYRWRSTGLRNLSFCGFIIANQFNCRWCNETEIKITDILVLPVQAYLMQFDGDWPDTFGFYLRASLWLAFDVPYVRVFYLNLLPTVERSRERIPTGARFFTPVQTEPGAYPASYTMGTGSFPGVKRRGVALTTHPHPAPRLKKEYSYTSTPPSKVFVAYCRVNFTFYYQKSPTVCTEVST